MNQRWDGDATIEWRGVARRLRPSFAAVVAIEGAAGRSLVALAGDIGNGAPRISDVALVIAECMNGAGERSPDTGRRFTADEVGAEMLSSALIQRQLLAIASALVLHALTGGEEGGHLMGEVQKAPETIVRRLGMRADPERGASGLAQ